MSETKAERAVGVVTFDQMVAEDGLTFVRGVMEGRHPCPPFADLLDIQLIDVKHGAVVFVARPTPRFFNPMGTIQGGWAATILDAAMGFSIHSTLKLGESYTTLEMKLNYVRPVLPTSGLVRCEGHVVHRGGRVATSEGKLFDEAGKLLSHSSETCIIFPPAGT